MWRFSDGLVVPPGTRCMWPGAQILRDEDNFSDGANFDGFRFARRAGGKRVKFEEGEKVNEEEEEEEKRKENAKELSDLM